MFEGLSWLIMLALALIVGGLSIMHYLQSAECQEQNGIPVRPPFSINIHCVKQLDR